MIIAEKENRKRQIDLLERAYERFSSSWIYTQTSFRSDLKSEKRLIMSYHWVVKKHLKFIEAYYDADTEATEKRSRNHKRY